MGFKTDLDVYTQDTADWKMSDWYMCYRWLSRVVVKSVKKPFYREILQSYDIDALNHEAQVMLVVLLGQVPLANDVLSDKQHEALERVRPLEYKLYLSEKPMCRPAYTKMGLYL